MAPRVCVWLATPLFLAAAAGCSDGVATSTADALMRLPTVPTSAQSTSEALPLYLEFESEKSKASISELPAQF